MFIHIKSPLFRDKVTDILINSSMVEAIDIVKKIREGKTIWHLMVMTDATKASECHETLESAKERMSEILEICGHSKGSAKEISYSFVPEDLENKEKQKCDHVADIIKEVILKTMTR